MFGRARGVQSVGVKPRRGPLPGAGTSMRQRKGRPEGSILGAAGAFYGAGVLCGQTRHRLHFDAIDVPQVVVPHEDLVALLLLELERVVMIHFRVRE